MIPVGENEFMTVQELMDHLSKCPDPDQQACIAIYDEDRGGTRFHVLGVASVGGENLPMFLVEPVCHFLPDKLEGPGYIPGTGIGLN